MSQALDAGPLLPGDVLCCLHGSWFSALALGEPTGPQHTGWGTACACQPSSPRGQDCGSPWQVRAGRRPMPHTATCSSTLGSHPTLKAARTQQTRDSQGSGLHLRITLRLQGQGVWTPGGALATPHGPAGVPPQSPRDQLRASSCDCGFKASCSSLAHDLQRGQAGADPSGILEVCGVGLGTGRRPSWGLTERPAPCSPRP